MRPRRFCRGELVAVLAKRIELLAASMRPRRFCRGELGEAEEGPGGDVARFNEAPAILPGRAGSRSVYSNIRPIGFNEAPAILPGRARKSYGRKPRKPKPLQ